MEILNTTSVSPEQYLDFLFCRGGLKKILGSTSCACFVVTRPIETPYFFDNLIKNVHTIDSTTRKYIAFVVFHGQSTVYTPVTYRVPIIDGNSLFGYESRQGFNAHRVNDISVSTTNNNYCFDKDYGELFRNEISHINHAQFSQHMTRSTAALMDYFKLREQNIPCLVFVDPDSMRSLNIQLPLQDPFQYMYRHILQPLSDAFRDFTEPPKAFDVVEHVLKNPSLGKAFHPNTREAKQKVKDNQNKEAIKLMELNDRQEILASVGFFIIPHVDEKALNNPEISYQSLIALNKILKEKVLNQKSSECKILSSISGAIVVVPDTLGIYIHQILPQILEECKNQGVPVRIGITHGDLEVLKDVDGSFSFIGVPTNVAARLAYSSENNSVLYHSSYCDLVQPLPTSRSKDPLHPKFCNEIKIEGKKHDQPFNCREPHQNSNLVLTDFDEIILPKSSDPIMTINAVAIAYDLPRFSQGDRNELSQRFRSVRDTIQSIKNDPIFSENPEFFFSPGGDGGILVLKVVLKIALKNYVKKALELIESLEVESDNRNPNIDVKSRVGIHYGLIILYENAEGVLRPTGLTCFIADKIASDEIAKQKGGLVITDKIKGSLFWGSKERFKKNYESLPPLNEGVGKQIVRYVQRPSDAYESLPIKASDTKKTPESVQEKKENVYQNHESARILELTKDFVGREYVFKAINEFIANNNKGYFTIIGDPGQGKSAILAKYVQDKKCIAHFNSVLIGITQPHQFLESVCLQLIERYKLTYDALPPHATRDGEFLGQLLTEVAKQSDGEPVIIAVDTLDEVDPTSYKNSSNILFLPAYLPDGVYFILTRRRGVEVPLTSFAPMPPPLNLLEFPNESEIDIRKYISNRVDSSENLRQGIDKRGETRPKFTETIAKKSENNFMYLRYVLLDIESGLYQDLTLEQFPQGLQGYYNFHWQRMGMKADYLPVEKIKIVYILGEVREPVSRRQICDISSEDEYTVQQVLNEWKQFLHELMKQENLCYSVYHSSFRDFLHRQDILGSHPVTIPGINQLIGDKSLRDWKKFKNLRNRRHE